MVSMIYFMMSSASCIKDKDNANRIGNCSDIVYSSVTLLEFISAILVVKLILIPQLPRVYTYQDIVRFNFDNFRCSLQVILVGLAAFITVCIFSSSSEIERPWSKIEEDLNLTYR